MKRIAIQGVKGSYHDMAAHQYFENEDIELICCSTFDGIFDAMKQDNNVIGLMAIENTIAGSLLHNYDLLRESHTTIVGEHKMRISHSLLCLPEEGWDDIVEINSHPVALAQCREFLLQHPDVKIVEAEDTAGSAELISRKQLKGHAAICSKSAAPLYDMKVLEEGIETNKHNFTRFLVVADPWKADELRDRSHINKATIVFSLPHCEGSLSQVLSIFSSASKSGCQCRSSSRSYHHRTGMGIPLLRRCRLRRLPALQAVHRRHHTPDERTSNTW